MCRHTLVHSWQDDIDEAVAAELLAAAPGLFVPHPGTGKLMVTQARDHEKHLEKVGVGEQAKGRTQCVFAPDKR